MGQRVKAVVAAWLAVALAADGCGAVRERSQADTAAEESSWSQADTAADVFPRPETDMTAGTGEEPAVEPIPEGAGKETGGEGENRGEEKEQPEEMPEWEGTLPSHYDAREDGRTSPVKDQGDLGTCWAFASLLALESTLLPDEVFDFSEDHMSRNPNFTLEQDEGGDYTMSMAYLLSWQGPVPEEDDPYGDGISPEGLTAVKHVQEIRILPEKDRETIKRAVYTIGGVQSSLYTTMRSRENRSEYYNQEAGAYCCPEDREPNHDVVIVGWDDTFPKENFAAKVEGDGAFLCENSWGSQFGEDGFFYVSYYDGNLGKTNIVYAVTETPENYDRIYQSDLCGWIGQIGYGDETAWAMNVYETGEQDESLEAVGFYTTGQNTDYEVYVVGEVPDDPLTHDGVCFAERVLSASGHLAYSGYYTIRLDKSCFLAANTRFGVMVRLTTAGVIHPVAIEYDAGDGKSRIDLGDGEGYISPDGEEWERAETGQRCNLCLKAYTSVPD